MTQAFIRCVKNEIRRNESLIARLMENPPNVQEGYVEREQRGRSVFYRLVRWEDGKRVREYLGTVKSKKFRDYLIGLCVMIRVGILQYNNKILRRLLALLQSDSVAAINARLPKTCRGLFTEGFVDERLEELKAWASADYKRNSRDFNDRKNIACDGTRVRSKGEIIIYNLLVALGIPFRYESLIYVTDDWGNRVVKCPDFLIQCYDGTFIIIEHLGGLLKADYCADFAKMCRYYLREGFVLGDNYFVTSDDANGGVSAEAIEEILQIVERRFYRAG